jgi:hypothetical protein
MIASLSESESSKHHAVDTIALLVLNPFAALIPSVLMLRDFA